MDIHADDRGPKSLMTSENTLSGAVAQSDYVNV